MFTPESADSLVKKLQEDVVCYETKDSVISTFFAGKCVFLTGGTGFLGKLLIEKLLRTCPDIVCIFMLARAKKGKDIHTRIDEIFNDVLFQKLSKLQPKFRHKIVLVQGDVSLPGLGLTIEDRKQITEKATIFIHSAATVKFNERLNLAIDINIKGTREVITLIKECQHVDSFVHVSTLFTHCYRPDIDEKFYDVPIDVEKVIQISDVTPPPLLDKITADILGIWPNTYVFTKAFAEDCIRKYASQLPVCIFRPAVITATYKEPVKCWIDNIYGPTGIAVGSGVGILRVANINQEAIAEIVPGDMVINAIITASYKTAVERKEEIPIYNYNSSTQNVLKWKDYMNINAYYGLQTPSSRCLWAYSLRLVANRIQYLLYAFFLHTIPGLLFDAALLVMGKKPQLTRAYSKIENLGSTLAYFGSRNWKIANDNTQNLYNQLTETDKKLFFFDISKVDWMEYLQIHCLGLRTYMLKEDIETIPQARKRYFKLQIAHYFLQFLGVALLLRIVYTLISFIFF